MYCRFVLMIMEKCWLQAATIELSNYGIWPTQKWLKHLQAIHQVWHLFILMGILLWFLWAEINKFLGICKITHSKQKTYQHLKVKMNLLFLLLFYYNIFSDFRQIFCFITKYVFITLQNVRLTKTASYNLVI